MPATMDLPRDAGFVEIADRVWVARHSWLDVNVTAVGGARGLVVIDTHSSEKAARAMVEDLRRATSAEVVAVVNTHDHFDHVFGNRVLAETWPGAPIIAHEDAAAAIAAHAQNREPVTDDPHAEERNQTRLHPPGTTFSSAMLIDLEDRAVELLHPGRGHTAGDLVAVIADAGVLVAGDLVEESSEEGGVPGFGGDCYPMSWPGTLDFVLQLIRTDTTVVPGHGNPVDREFVELQRDAIAGVAETIRSLAHRGFRLDQALKADEEWPYPVEHLADAIRRGFEELPASAKRLPLF